MISSKRYQEYKSSGVNFIEDIPSHWEIRKLKFLSKLYTGNSIANKENYLDDENTYPYIATKDIDRDSNKINYDNGIFIKKDDNSFKIAEKNSTLLCVEGANAGKKLGFADREICFGNKLCLIKSLNNAIYDKYIFYFAQSQMFKKDFFSSLNGMIGGVSLNVIKNFDITLPPFQEQEKIANFLDIKSKQIEEFIKDKENQIKLLEEQKEAIINKAVTKGLDDSVEFKDSGIEWIGDIPESWEVKKLKYCAKVVLGKMLCNTDKGNYQLKSYLKSKNIQWMNINTESVEKMWFSEYEMSLYKLNKNDLVLSEGGEVGKTSLWNNEIDECYIQNSVHKVTVSNDNLSKYYLYLFFLYGRVGYFDSLVNRVSIAHLTKEKLENIECIVAPKEEQKQIIKYIETETSKINEVITQIQKECELIKEYKISLISEVVTGQIKVV